MSGSSVPRRRRLPRRLRFSRAGLLFTMGTVATGGAAIHSGNNLLFLLVGGMLGLIAINGVLSERCLRKLVVRRIAVSSAPAGQGIPVRYYVENGRPRLPLVALQIREAGRKASAFVPYLKAGESTTAEARLAFPRRGAYALGVVTLSTSFPFGLFHKERDVQLAGEVLVWPRVAASVSAADYEVMASNQAARRQEVGALARTGRTEYASLRDYRSGDDARDVHWASTAKRGELVVREFEGRDPQPRWLVVDTRTRPDDRAEAMLEKAARVVQEFNELGTAFGFVAGPVRVTPGRGRRHLRAVYDAMARLQFGGGRESANGPHVPEGAILFSGRSA